jgi:general secretion pathway protein D
MISFNNLREMLALFGVILLLAPASLEARNRKGDKFLKQAHAAEDRKEYEKALELYEQALSQDPADPGYQLGMRRVRFQAGEVHVAAGQKLRQAGALEDALVEFQRAFSIDPASAIALQELRRTTQMIEEQKRGAAKPGEAALTPIEKARKESTDRISSLLPVPELKPISNQIHTLKMNNQPPKVLYETVGKLAGVNVVFDPQYQSSGKNVNLDLNDTTLEEALNYIALLTKTFWKPIASNAIFVAEDNVTKRRDYEDEVVKVFYLQNVTSVQEFQEIVTAVRSVTDIRRMFTYNAQNVVMARGTVDQIALAEKLFHDLDKPKAEVVIDIIVLNANSTRTRNLAAALVSGGQTGGINQGITFGQSVTTPGTPATATAPAVAPTTTVTGSNITLNRIPKISIHDFTTSVPGALLQAVLNDNLTRVMQSPQVRVSDGQKVTLKIGDKIPYATGSFQPGFGSVGTGVSPLVSTQFNFAETGVNLEITPNVHGTEEVTMHISIDISNVSSYVNLGGLSQPVISQKKNEAFVRVRDGEVNLLGGLISSQDSSTLVGIPGLVNIPILGKILGATNTKERDRGELLIAIIPHIVRTPNLTPMDLRTVAAGTDATVKMNYAPKEMPPAPAPAPVVPAPAPAAAPTPAPSGPPKLSWSPASVTTALSGPVMLVLQLDNAADVFAAPIRVKWDPKILQLKAITPGGLLAADGKANPPVLDIRNDAGEASFNLSRVAGAGGVDGSGVLAQFTFMAIGKGSASVTVSEAALKDSKQQAITLATPAVAVVVQ